MSPDLIPALEPTPIPAPVWLFQALLLFTFLLHVLFMNLTLGGTLLAAVSQIAAGGRPDDPRAVLARRLMAVNAYGISMAITTGIAPLLFVQVLYQQYFYTATILIAWAWLGLLLALMAGYYSAYVYKFKTVVSGRSGGRFWLGLAGVMFLLVAMVHVAVNLIHAQPSKWTAIAGNPWAVLGDPAYFPRLLHFVPAALGLSALLAAWWAVRRARAGHEVELNGRIARFAWRWVLWTTVVQFAGGFLLLFTLPREVLLGMMRGGAATLGPLTLAILLGVGLLMMVARVSDPLEKPGAVTGTLAALVLTAAVMVITRHQVRDLYLAPWTAEVTPAVASQWGNLLLFVVVLVAGLATVAFMVRRVLDERRAA